MVKFLGYQGDKIKFYTTQPLDPSTYCLTKIEQTEDEYVLSDDMTEYVPKDEAWEAQQAQKEREQIAMLKMTPLDFLKAIQTLGVTYEQIKDLCDNNSEVDMELKFCNHVYRGNPLLDQLAMLFNVTTEQLDELFKTYGE